MVSPLEVLFSFGATFGYRGWQQTFYVTGLDCTLYINPAGDNSFDANLPAPKIEYIESLTKKKMSQIS